jgi:hypothetical protein
MGMQGQAQREAERGPASGRVALLHAHRAQHGGQYGGLDEAGMRHQQHRAERPVGKPHGQREELAHRSSAHALADGVGERELECIEHADEGKRGGGGLGGGERRRQQVEPDRSEVGAGIDYRTLQRMELALLRCARRRPGRVRHRG